MSKEQSQGTSEFLEKVCIGGRKWRSGRVFTGKSAAMPPPTCGKEVAEKHLLKRRAVPFFPRFF